MVVATSPGTVKASSVAVGGGGGAAASAWDACTASTMPCPKSLSGPAIPRSLAVWMTAASACAALAPGYPPRRSASKPVTWGAAMEVPDTFA